MKHLTLKTVFLLALGSGKHRSEIHAWQKKYKSPVRLVKGLLVPLTQLSAGQGGSSVAPVVIPALAPILDKSLRSDRSLCPVRALHYYLDRTSDLRQNKEEVFVSLKEGFNKDIPAATISSWIKQTVIPCYELSVQEVHTLHQVKVHDMRAFVCF